MVYVSGMFPANWGIIHMPPNRTFKKREAKTTIDMDVSKKWYPQIIHFNRVFHYKPSILGYPYFWKHPYGRKIMHHLTTFHLFIIGSWVMRNGTHPGLEPLSWGKNQGLPLAQRAYQNNKKLSLTQKKWGAKLHQKAVEENHMVQVALECSFFCLEYHPIAKVFPSWRNVWLNWSLRETFHSHIRIKIYNQIVVLSMMPLKLIPLIILISYIENSVKKSGEKQNTKNLGPTGLPPAFLLTPQNLNLEEFAPKKWWSEDNPFLFKMLNFQGQTVKLWGNYLLQKKHLKLFFLLNQFTSSQIGVLVSHRIHVWYLYLLHEWLIFMVFM